MHVRVGKSEREWIDLAWTWLHREIEVGQSVFMPAGGTPTALYRHACQIPSPLLRTLKLLQLDEIISGPLQGNFRAYLEKELAPFVDQIQWISQGDATADVSILGVGINGHVAFHEPFLARDFTSGCVLLSDEIQNYLELKDPTWGVTYGCGTFLKSKKILVLARGEKKRQILQRAIARRDLPISYILEHPNVTLITDFEL
ncbi:MAG TPA: 6-phosphogluconolactonase [Bdellovibrionales bacterium]|nr:6-phosphogluconolactonase [Bdellovibrionales bacterium]